MNIGMLRSLRYSAVIRRSFIRFQSSTSKSFGSWEYDETPINFDKALSHQRTILPFAYRKESEAFGQLVKNQHDEHDLDDSNYKSKIRVITREEYLQRELERSPPRDQEGNALFDQTGQEARLDPKTVEGRAPRPQVQIPPVVAKTIHLHIISLREVKRLRTAVSDSYVALQESKVHKQTKSEMECDAHIAGMFIQNYASIYQSLSELKKRMPDFNPQSVLDIGFGPATGMIALNELMGNEFRPKVKDALIVGHKGMKDRAKILLSRQVNEYPGDIKDLEVPEEEIDEEIMGAYEDGVFQREEDERVGGIKTNQIKIKTKLRDYLSPTKKYDLIIATHQMLQDASRFPYQVDENVDILLKSLLPNGHLVIVERGNPLGFEIIARARQIMIRPEKYGNENGKIPRPYKKNPDTKGKNKDNLGKFTDEIRFAKELEERFGEASEEDLEFESSIQGEAADELDKVAYQLAKKAEEDESTSYHLSIVAPCPHHHKCPLQTLRPDYYETPTGRKLDWCHYEKSVQRPKFSLELKRGKVLASKWSTPTSGRSEVGFAGSGRPNGKNYEVASYSYLIAHRSKIDGKTVAKIENQRENANHDDLLGTTGENSKDWPRIMLQPLKRKGHITMSICGNSGKLEKWTVSKSDGAQRYHDARKASAGDLWPLGAKTKQLSNSSVNEMRITKIENYMKEAAKRDAKEKSRLTRDKKRMAAQKIQELGTEATIEDKIDVWVEAFDNRKIQIQEDRRGGHRRTTKNKAYR